MSVTLRKAEATDVDILRELFSNCVMTVCVNDYSNEQLKVWISAADNRDIWSDKIRFQFFQVAEREGTIVGFGSLEGHDIIDLLYVHPEFQRIGIANGILGALLSRSKKEHVSLIKADVSKTARPFFESHGFRVRQEQAVTSHGISVINYKMEKNL